MLMQKKYINWKRTFFTKSINGYGLLIAFLILAALSFALPKIVFAKESSFPGQVVVSKNKKISSEDIPVFPFNRSTVNVASYFTEKNLKFDPNLNPDGIFTSDNQDTSSYSDAKARQELIQLNTSSKKSFISYIDVGDPSADPIVLFHGIPTSSFEWRQIISLLKKHARVIAFDQIGQGHSTKHKQLTYTFKQHLAYTEAFFSALKLDQKKITIVATDTGGSLCFAYAMRHPDKIKGLAFFETVFGPVPTLEAMTAQAQVFRSMEGNRKIIEENTFIENLIVHSAEVIPPNTVPFAIEPFTAEEIRAYKFPYHKKEHRRVLAQWVLEIPFIGGALDGYGDANIDIWSQFSTYLMTSPVPKFYLFAEPGVLNTIGITNFVLENFNTNGSLSWVNLGVGYHFLHEDYAEQIGKEIANWHQSLR